MDGNVHVLNCKAGVAIFPLDHSELARIPELTEAALRDAKLNNESVVFFSGQSHNRLLRQIIVEQELEKAIRGRTIEVHLQPKVVLATSAIHSFEALARWNHAELGPVSPAEFIPIAETSGLAPELDRYIVSRVTELIAELSAGGKTCLPIAVNITADHFSDDGLFTYIAEALGEYSLPASAIELEITERAVVNLSSTVSENLRRLRERGMKISIDDFGTGYSSLSYLKKLDIDELKIDKSFIDDIEDPKGFEMVKAVVSLAHSFGLSVTAEGIETGVQAELLVQMGCELGQGYYFSRPLPPAEAVKIDLSSGA